MMFKHRVMTVNGKQTETLRFAVLFHLSSRVKIIVANRLVVGEERNFVNPDGQEFKWQSLSKR